MSSQDKNSGNMVNLNRCLPSGGVIFCQGKIRDVYFPFTFISSRSQFLNLQNYWYRTPFRFRQLFISNRKAGCGRLKIRFFYLQNVDSEDEVSESDETVEELLAIGNDSVQHDDLKDSENEALATPQKEKASTYTPVTNLSGIEGVLFSVTETCPLPSLPSTSLEDSTSPEQNGGSRSSHQSRSLVTGRSDGEKTPVQSKLEESKKFCLNLLGLFSVYKSCNADCCTEDCLCFLH